MWHILFFCSLVLLFTLPMVPALIEWRRKKDAAPLKVVREYDGSITHFANRFRDFLHNQIRPRLSGMEGRNEAVAGLLENGTPYQLVGVTGIPEFTSAELANKSTDKLVLGQSPLHLPDRMFFESEVYAGEGIASGNWNVFRAILADADVRLGEGCDVIRWAHGKKCLAFGARTRLFGRISADEEILVSRQSQFVRMNAPRIRFGALTSNGADTSAEVINEARALALPDRIIDDAAGRTLVDGNLDIPTRSFHRGSLVARKNLHVGEGSFIMGSIKSNRNLRLEKNLRIDGAIVASHNLHIGPGCLVKGPIAGEGQIVIQSGSIIGTSQHPTTITAPDIRIEEGVIVHGTVWAREKGYVAASAETGKGKPA